MRDKHQIMAAFNAYNLHDDTVQAVRILPSPSRRRQSTVEIDLTEYVSDKPRRLRLTGCANLSFIADFDVLTDNAFANTEGVQASGDEERIRQIVTAQMAHLNLDYGDSDEEPDEHHPTRRKLADLSPFILFRVTFYGGTLEVVARGFQITRPRLPAPQSGRRPTR